jgi:hypothetical protein
MLFGETAPVRIPTTGTATADATIEYYHRRGRTDRAAFRSVL